MGADLLLAVVARPKNKKLNWPAGRDVVRKIDGNVLVQAIEEIDGDCDGGSVTFARHRANEIITELKAELTDRANLDGRDAYEWHVGSYHLSIRGGTSWGDDPSDGWTRFSNAQGLPPEVLKAIGFSRGAVKWAEDGLN